MEEDAANRASLGQQLVERLPTREGITELSQTARDVVSGVLRKAYTRASDTAGKVQSEFEKKMAERREKIERTEAIEAQNRAELARVFSQAQAERTFIPLQGVPPMPRLEGTRKEREDFSVPPAHLTIMDTGASDVRAHWITRIIFRRPSANRWPNSTRIFGRPCSIARQTNSKSAQNLFSITG